MLVNILLKEWVGISFAYYLNLQEAKLRALERRSGRVSSRRGDIHTAQLRSLTFVSGCFLPLNNVYFCHFRLQPILTRVVVIRCLVVYLGESLDHLLKE